MRSLNNSKDVILLKFISEIGYDRRQAGNHSQGRQRYIVISTATSLASHSSFFSFPVIRIFNHLMHADAH